jgi:hypothetical protein
MGNGFTVTIMDPQRKAEWESIFGTATVRVKSPVPVLADLPGKPNSMIFELDLEAITPEQRGKLVAHLAGKFGISAVEVEANLDDHGVPILAEHCVASGISLRHLL